MSAISRHCTGRRRLILLASVAVVLGVVLTSVVWIAVRGDGELAGDAVVTSSSTAPGFSARDVVSSGAMSTPGAEWRSDRETVGAWVELSWSSAHPVRRLVIVRNAVDEPGVTEGFLAFGDGSYLQVRLSATSRDTVIPISPRTVDRVRFTASAVSDGAQYVSVSEMSVSSAPADDDVATEDVDGGNVAPAAVASQGLGADGTDPHALQDGAATSAVADTGDDWTVDRPSGAWVQLDWDRPREVTSLVLVGGAQREGARLTAATVTFTDGASLVLGAVSSDRGRPTVLSFMPRVTRSIHLTLDKVDGDGALALGELRVYQRGATPARPERVGRPDELRPAPVPACPPSAGPPPKPLTVLCPQTSSVVQDTIDLALSVESGYSAVAATVWPADEAEPAGPVVRAAPDASGLASLSIDVSGVPPGPFTVELVATGEGRAAAAIYFQLYRRGAFHGDVPSSTAAIGRTMVYAEEFDRPITLSRNGIGADYAGAKPVHNGDQDFGDAIFPGNAIGFPNIRVVDDRYLRMDVEPIPPGYTDPQGWGRTHLGGMLASGREGGAGFSAQFGYFEARMLVPAAPGTWPAFWTLPSDDLIEPTRTQAEFDAVEVYGHDPKMACQATHSHRSGNDGDSYCAERFATERSALSWHTYGVSILPTGITFYIDGHVVATAPQVEGGAAPMFFLVDLALGGGWPVDLGAVQDRATLYVDYVRVYV